MVLSINGFSCGYDENSSKKEEPLLADLHFGVQKSKIVTIFGSNGSGKTTLLNWLAGYPTPNTFWFQSSSVNMPDSKFVGYVPQTPSKSIFEWLSGIENLVFPFFLKSGNWDDAFEEIDEVFITEINDLFNQSLPLKKLGGSMSGGEMQSIILTRELLFAKELLLLDEAVSAIDHKRRRKIILGLRKIAKKLNLAILSVTHNIEEAVVFSDQVLVLKNSEFKLIEIEQKSQDISAKQLSKYIQKIMQVVVE
ncbi:MAG: ATP-binding cassette domain-containing protein [Balneola sp.]